MADEPTFEQDELDAIVAATEERIAAWLETQRADRRRESERTQALYIGFMKALATLIRNGEHRAGTEPPKGDQ